MLRQTVSQSVSQPICLVVKPHLGPKTRLGLLMVAGLFMRGDFYDGGQGLSSTVAADPSPAQLYLSRSKSAVLTISIYNLTRRHSTQSVVKGLVLYGHRIFAIFTCKSYNEDEIWHSRSHPNSCSSRYKGCLVT
jgi:hypothetical protein